MSKGYAEGPALEERLADLERPAGAVAPQQPTRSAVFGSTEAEPAPHFVGWADEVDADALFADGSVFGITLRKIPA